MIRTIIAASVPAALIIGAAALFLWAMPVQAVECAGTVGKASFYAEAHHGKTMANGRPFNMHAMTAASNSLPLGAKARVTYGKRSVVVTITDTGGFGKYGRIIDLSKGAFAKLAHTDKGIIRVCVARVSHVIAPSFPPPEQYDGSHMHPQPLASRG
jgi:rare lipoprotein A